MSSVLIGTWFGSFRIERLLGRGGSGEVYLAYDVELGRRVALKLLSEAHVGDDALRDRFTRETRILATVEHPNVIPMYAAGVIDDRLYIAMRYIPEGSLRRRLRARALELDDGVRVVSQIADALDAAHAQNFVHRDVKPENIMVDATGTAYLVDFFVAAAAPAPGTVFGDAGLHGS